jgi:hypothetical protein
LVGNELEHKGVTIHLRRQPRANQLQRLRGAHGGVTASTAADCRQGDGIAVVAKMSAATYIGIGARRIFTVFEAELEALNKGECVIGGADFGVIHNLELGVVEPSHRQLHIGARGNLEHCRHRAVAGYVRRIDHVEIFQPCALHRDLVARVVTEFLRQARGRLIRADCQHRGSAAAKRGIKFAYSRIPVDEGVLRNGVGVIARQGESGGLVNHGNELDRLYGSKIITAAKQDTASSLNPGQACSLARDPSTARIGFEPVRQL